MFGMKDRGAYSSLGYPVPTGFRHEALRFPFFAYRNLLLFYVFFGLIDFTALNGHSHWLFKVHVIIGMIFFRPSRINQYD